MSKNQRLWATLLGLWLAGAVTMFAAAPILVNQIGYQRGAPKRFTAPLSPDGTAYVITFATNREALFAGQITGGRGDFSAFEPTNPGPYIIHLPSTQPEGASNPFLVMSNLVADKLLLPAVEFMVDCRSGVGTHPSAFGGCPWRDGTYYSFEVPSLIYLFLNDPDAILRQPREVNHAAEKARVLAPDYASKVFVHSTEDAGFVPALQKYYRNWPPPLRSDMPDALQCVQFGLGITVEQPATRDWTDETLPRQINSQELEWCAYFLYSWPVLRDWFPDAFYRRVHDFAFTHWKISGPHNPSPLEVDPLWDPGTYGTNYAPFKGRHAPGHSILPNLLMWQVARRENRPDAPDYLLAAQKQTQWVIDRLDWNDPLTTKGQRMSEFKTMTGLAWFETHFPGQAPAGLRAKIEAWADVMIARSDNLWDYRRFDLGTNWSIPALKPNWNEPGNLAGFPACALAAATVVDDPAKKQRLREISWAALDCLFGRNPLGAASPSRPQLGFPDVERGWPSGFSGPAAYLEHVRGTLNSAPGTEVFPYKPQGALRYAEGWTHFNAAWNVGLAYLLADLKHSDPLPVRFPLVVDKIALPAGAIELSNPTRRPVRLSGLTLLGDVHFTFAPNVPDLPAGGRCVVVRDSAAEKAGVTAYGPYSGQLSASHPVVRIGDINGNVFTN